MSRSIGGALADNAAHAAFEDAEEAFNGAGMGIVPHVFTGRMLIPLVVRNLATNLDVVPGPIAPQARFFGDVSANDRR